MNYQPLQESYYKAGVDYRHGSPHLSYLPLNDRLVGVLRSCISDLSVAGLPLRVLEVGAGHGGFTEPALAAGCDITAVEMSQASLAELGARYRTNPKFTCVFDPDGTLSDIDGEYSLVLCVAVLHHIPDYLKFLTNVCDRLAPGGTLLTLQDPLWYPRMKAVAHRADRAAYMVWRSTQGELGKGFASLTRRLRNRYDETNPSDMVEYHVMRRGVDEEAMRDLLAERFADISVVRYWSNQLRAGQRTGDRLGWENTFGMIATGRR